MDVSTKQKIWSLKDIIYITLISAILGFLFLQIALFVPYSKPIKAIIIELGFYGSMASVIFIFLKHKGIPFSHFGFDDIKFKWVALSILAGIFVTFAGAFLSGIFAKILDLEVGGVSGVKDIMTGNVVFDYFQLKIIAGMFIPFVEEIYFRGIIFKFIRQNKGFWLSALLSTLIFSLFHFNLVMIPFTLLLGLTCAFVYEKTNSIFYAIAVHASVNMFAMNMVLFGFYM